MSGSMDEGQPGIATMTRPGPPAAPSVESAYQPIVDLRTGRTVGYEALARFPGAGDIGPEEVFRTATEAGADALAALDHACIRAAIEGAIAAELPSSTSLFVNVLPTSLQRTMPDSLRDAVQLAKQRLRIVAEVTEIDVMARPAELLALAAWTRRHGFGLAVDDVGANPQSLSLLPLLRPDVIKLDRSIIASRPSRETGRVLNAVLAAAETSGAAVLAEGIEHECDAHVARTLGATYGQGWHLGRPGPLPARTDHADSAVPLLTSARPAVPASPFDLVQGRLLGRDAPYEYLLAMSLDLEAKAARLDAPIVLSTFQEADRFTPATRRRYERLAQTSSLVGVLAAGLSEAPAVGVRGSDLPCGDAVRHDWIVVVLAPHFSAALIARDLTGSGPVERRRYDYSVTHDPEIVTRSAHSLLDRLTPAI